MKASTESKLNEIAALREGWDSYGGLPIAPEVIAGIRIFLEALEELELDFYIVPTSDGGISLETSLKTAELSFGFDGDKTFNFFITGPSGSFETHIYAAP